MQDLILRLIEGDARLLEQFAASKKAWNEFLVEFGDLPRAELSEKLSMYQSRLEAPFDGDRPFAKEMLPLTGLACLWSRQRDGFADIELADKLIEAIRRSDMSQEITHGYLRQALETFPQKD